MVSNILSLPILHKGMPGLPPAKTYMTVYRKQFPWISRPLNTWRTRVKGHILTLFSISGTWFSFSPDIYSYVRGLVIRSCSENNHRSMSHELISCVYRHSQFTQELVKWTKKCFPSLWGVWEISALGMNEAKTGHLSWSHTRAMFGHKAETKP